MSEMTETAREQSDERPGPVPAPLPRLESGFFGSTAPHGGMASLVRRPALVSGVRRLSRAFTERSASRLVLSGGRRARRRGEGRRDSALGQAVPRACRHGLRGRRRWCGDLVGLVTAPCGMVVAPCWMQHTSPGCRRRGEAISVSRAARDRGTERAAPGWYCWCAKRGSPLCICATS